MIDLEQKMRVIREWLGPGTINSHGRQFSGKDATVKKIGQYCGVEHISGGDVMRNADVSDDVRAIIDSGSLCPSEIYKATVFPRLGETALHGKPLLLSAVGRMREEVAPVLLKAEQTGHPTMAVINLEITEEEAFRRLQTTQRGRADDTPEVLRRRLDGFNDETTQVLQMYEDMGLLVTVDAMQPKEVVFDTVVQLLYQRATE